MLVRDRMQTRKKGNSQHDCMIVMPQCSHTFSSCTVLSSHLPYYECCFDIPQTLQSNTLQYLFKHTLKHLVSLCPSLVTSSHFTLSLPSLSSYPHHPTPITHTGIVKEIVVPPYPTKNHYHALFRRNQIPLIERVWIETV